MRDWAYAWLMAIAIAVVPNLVQVLIGYVGSSAESAVSEGTRTPSSGDKLWIIGSLALGAAIVPMTVFGVRGPAVEKGDRTRRYAITLIIAGIAGSAYLLAVVGIGESKGFGAGLGETIDSGLSPVVYIMVLVASGTIALSIRAGIGAVLAIAGILVILGKTCKLPENLTTSSWRDSDLILLVFGVLGACGTAASLYYLRRLYRIHKAKLGYCILLRYGGVAVVYILTAVFLDRSWWNSQTFVVALLAFMVGGIFITLVFVAAVRIDSDAVTAAALAMTPFAAVGIEWLFQRQSHTSRMDFADPVLWCAIGFTAVGVLWLQRDPGSKVIAGS